MAKEGRRLTRELVQESLAKSDAEREQDRLNARKKKKRKLGARVTMVTRAAANTIGNTLADAAKAEVKHIDFKTRVTSLLLGAGLALSPTSPRSLR